MGEKREESRRNDLFMILGKLNMFKDDELGMIENKITEIRGERNGSCLELKLISNKNIGDGKCWIAKVMKNTTKILSFVKEEKKLKDDEDRIIKYFKLKDGYYLRHESEIKEKRTYFEVKDGKIIDLD